MRLEELAIKPLRRGASTFLILALFGATGWMPTARAQNKGTNPGARVTTNPCGLVSSRDIQAIEGERVADKKSSQQDARTFLLLACFYRTPTFAKSVSVALAVPNPGGPKTAGPREFWEERFGGQESTPGHVRSGTNADRKEEEWEQGTKPVEISGLGEQAYWIPDPHIGTLYVLRGDSFLRISLGGKEDDAARSDKAKRLARIALSRLESPTLRR